MIKITFPDGSAREYDNGINSMEIAEQISPRLAKEIYSATVNGELWDLMRPINTDSTLMLHKWDDEEGKHAFWHSSAHLMAEALESLYPGIKFGIGPAIENGFYYDVDPGDGKVITEADLVTVETRMKELAARNLTYNRRDISKKEAIDLFTKKGDEYKTELISELEDGTITLYTQGNFTDLCRGPHLPSTEPLKAIKLLSVAGAYWRGNENRKMLTRIYGITFPRQKLLDDYLVFLEEAKRRDHRRIGKELELFTFSPKVGMGLPLWLPKGSDIRQNLITFLTGVLRKRGYKIVTTPHIGNVNLYKTSGHFEKYGADSFQAISTPQEGEQFMLKPMNCPHHCEIYNATPHSYKDLPLRMAEFGTVYRYEQSGELHGLTRVRSFTQDDAHHFCRHDQLRDEFKSIIDLILYVFRILNFNDFTAQVSLRDPENKEKYIGSDENWEKAERDIIEAAAEMNLQTKVVTGEAAFYGPKLDFMVKDAIGRKWQLGTIQVDYNLPERFDLTYNGSDNQKHRPVMIHRTIFGSMERFVAVLIENTAGKFPLWLAPEKAVILPISEKFNDYAGKVLEILNNSDICTLIDERSEKIGKKIRDNELKRIPYLLVIGEKEAENGTIAVRKQGEGDKGSMKIDEFISFIHEEIKKEIAI
ncbi:MAG: threonine--tRNA ligase [Bacteroidetes bacterium GWE2_41_25]|nr:MAG: threonine--tRNA ligase [Bacteroidetes bacterium GWA2_40_15]OFX97714.1 MAG: threonine--tRNA ligase [Bacteroidetes bacterium GWC2_40_22]OFY13051.1 MAG: threonine--tRNA ligase [Bacteroidetes bacterium GWE2_41_25]HBH82237.1 threonine--tRNA ligase [Bacteroidales bacterium]HCU17869.1 threonine--tRNA ligase [Bacteroidales bacterium]